MLNPPRIFFLVVLLLSTPFCKTGLTQSSIVLRDLTLVDSSIADFDRSSLSLSDGSILGWDQILQAEVSPNRQAEFDRNMHEIGLPLFRLKTRIKQGSWSGAGEISEPIFDSLEKSDLGSNSVNAELEYLACLATAKSRLRSGNRAQAVLAIERAAKAQSKVGDPTLNLVGPNRLPIENDPVILDTELLPVWFDLEQLQKNDAEISKAFEGAATSEKFSDRLAIFLASMKIEVGQTEVANRLLNQLRTSKPEVRAWKIVLQARMLQRAGEYVKAQSLLDKNAESLTGSARATALYYRGVSGKEMVVGDKPASEIEINAATDFDLSKSALLLMRIPSLYGNTHPGLSAAALFQAAEITKLRGRYLEAEKIKRQLVRTYPSTYHGSIESTENPQRD